VPFDRVMQPGETYHVPERPELLLTTGNAGGLAVQVAGETLPPLGADRAVRRNLPLDPADLRRAVVAGVR
jgi:cytoskeleton protein RodZ